MQHSAKKGHSSQRKAMKVEKLLLGGSCSELVGGVEAEEDAGFHGGAVNGPFTSGADPSTFCCCCLRLLLEFLRTHMHFKLWDGQKTRGSGQQMYFERLTLWPFLATDAELLQTSGCFFCAWVATDQFVKSAPALHTGQIGNLGLYRCCCTPLGYLTSFLLRAWCSVPAEGMQLSSLSGSRWIFDWGLLVTVDQTGGSHGQDVKVGMQCTSSGE